MGKIYKLHLSIFIAYLLCIFSIAEAREDVNLKPEQSDEYTNGFADAVYYAETTNYTGLIILSYASTFMTSCGAGWLYTESLNLTLFDNTSPRYGCLALSSISAGIATGFIIFLIEGDPETKPENLMGKSSEYLQGYADGCEEAQLQKRKQNRIFTGTCLGTLTGCITAGIFTYAIMDLKTGIEEGCSSAEITYP